jgi:hypothetical protein
MGYSLLRRIILANEGFLPRNALHSFLIVLATYQRHRPIASGIWASILGTTPDRPTDNWSEARRFMAHPSVLLPDFGLTFVPPANENSPWDIRTQWREDEFMQLLMAIRPSQQSLLHLLYYADAFVRSRPCAVPAPGIAFPQYSRDDMFAAPYISAPRVPNSFFGSLDNPSTTTTSGPAPMEVDDGNTSPSREREATPLSSPPSTPP